MAKIRKHLKNAPLKEAVIDLRTSLAEDISGERFLELKDVLSADYPKVQERREMKAEFKVGEGQARTIQLGVHGIWFTSEDDGQIAQFRRDGFTFSRLRPYTRWKHVFPEALRMWGHYLDIAPVHEVTRVALRYINRINLPLPVGDFGNHFTAPPEIPEGLPQSLAGFICRVLMVDEETGNLATVTQSLEKGLDEKSISIILDIDAYREGPPYFSKDEAELVPIFEELHAFKNRIFFGFITEQTAQRYE